MDEAVIHAMARWPDVPAVFGWLRLDQRGQWRMIQRDAPGFDPQRDARGETISSPAIIDFIGRNYAADQQGRWFWQNGPQRVFVNLDAAPLIFRVFESAKHHEKRMLVTHTGYPVSHIEDACIDAQGRIFFRSEHGPGMIHDLDLAQLDLQALPGDDPVACNWHWLKHSPDALELRIRPIEDAAAHYGFAYEPR